MEKIPLSLSDFDGGAFSKIAKFLSKKWPIAGGRPTLSKSQIILSEILGYNDFHDASKSASDSYSERHWNRDYESLLSGNVYRAICGLSSDNDVESNLKVIFDFCDSVPFGHLSFFRQTKPQILVSDEATDAFITIYESMIVHHEHNAKSQLHSLPGCVAYALTGEAGLDLILKRVPINSALEASEFPGGLNALNFVKTNVHDIVFRKAFDEFTDRGNRSSIYSLNSCEGFSHEKYQQELAKPEALAVLNQRAFSYLESDILTKPCEWIFNRGIGSEEILFDADNWCMSHPYGFLTGEVEDEEEFEDDEEFQSSYLEEMGSYHALAQEAFDFCSLEQDGKESTSFDIFYVDPDGMDTFSFYNWMLQKKDESGKLIVLVAGIAFSPSYKGGVTAWDMMDLADTQSGTDCDSVSWTLGEYQKTLSKKHQDLDLYRLPIGKLTSSHPTVIVHSVERSFSNGVVKGLGITSLISAVKNLEGFFGSEVNLSIMIEPKQYRNLKVSHEVFKTSRDFSSKRLIKYFRESLSSMNKVGIRNLFLPRAYPTHSD